MTKTYTLELKSLELSLVYKSLGVTRDLFRNHPDWYEVQYSQRKIKQLNELRKRIEVIRKEQNNG